MTPETTAPPGYSNAYAGSTVDACEGSRVTAHEDSIVIPHEGSPATYLHDAAPATSNSTNAVSSDVLSLLRARAEALAAYQAAQSAVEAASASALGANLDVRG